MVAKKVFSAPLGPSPGSATDDVEEFLWLLLFPCDTYFRYLLPTSTYFRVMFLTSLRKHPFLLALCCWGRFAWRNVCDSGTAIPY